MTADEAAKAPADMKMKDMTGMAGYKFAISVSALDCTGCGSCANVCPGMKLSLIHICCTPGSIYCPVWCTNTLDMITWAFTWGLRK